MPAERNVGVWPARSRARPASPAAPSLWPRPWKSSNSAEPFASLQSSPWAQPVRTSRLKPSKLRASAAAHLRLSGAEERKIGLEIGSLGAGMWGIAAKGFSYVPERGMPVLCFAHCIPRRSTSAYMGARSGSKDLSKGLMFATRNYLNRLPTVAAQGQVLPAPSKSRVDRPRSRITKCQHLFPYPSVYALMHPSIGASIASLLLNCLHTPLAM